MDNFASIDRKHDATVYDITGNPIGTVAEIFGEAPSDPISAGTHPSRSVSD
jgi:hypothetical protein